MTRAARLCFPVTLAALLASAGCGEADSEGPNFDPARFAVRVVSFTPGEDAGYGAEGLPGVVFGPPLGSGDRQGSFDVVALGHGGEITLELGEPAVDGAGADLIVFENAFFYGNGDIFAEPAFVEVSADGETFERFPCEPESDGFEGCAGVMPVYARGDSADIDPLDPKTAGGDAFDLADVGLGEARFVRIVDSGVGPGQSPSAGFDLDAVAVVHVAAGE